ncbi:MAG TPA: DUF2723 domain-containing protein [Gemmatimonadaceae bacterium]|nr:DUF2723 domain-containing protein [Gemmatimonadaceae bacterium]
MPLARAYVTRIYLVIGLVAVLAGYLDLWRGGTSLAAVLLVLGYCVLLPVAIGPRRSEGGRPTAERPGYGAALVVFVAVLALYAVTLAPTTAMWDASEYIAVARVLGLPHPPGNPMFVLIAHVAGLVPLPVEYAVRINLLAAVASAASAALWFLCGEWTLRGMVPDRRWRGVAAAAGALLGAVAFTVWNQSVVNEKVYTVSLLGLALGSWLVVRWLAEDDERRADRLLLLVAYLAGLAYTVHPAGLLTAPAVAAAVIARRPRTLLRWRLLLALGALLLAGLTPFATEPIRSAHLPPINEGLPTACEGGRPEVGCTLSSETWRRLSANVRREQYGGHPVLERQAPLGQQLGMFWQYFRWQWLRDGDGRYPRTQGLIAVAMVALGLTGIVTLRRHHRAAWWYFAPLTFTLTLALVYYLNFKYGWSQAPEVTDPDLHEVRERDYFYVWSFSLWGLLAGLGLAAAWRALASRFARGGGSRAPRWLATSPLMLLALAPVALNWRDASRSGQEFTRHWAADMLNSVEPYGVLVTNGDNDSFPLWYAQQVEGIRRDVTIALTPYLGLPWYARELVRQTPERYDAARGPAIYRGRDWPRPTAPLWRLGPAELDAIPGYVTLQTPQRFVHGAIDATLPAGYLTRDRLLVLRAIKDGFPDRPLYFSLGNYPHTLGLAPYLRRQGLVQRLDPRPLAASAAIVPVGESWMDLPRSDALWRSIYGGHRQLLREGRWLDAPSASIPSAYAFVGQQLAYAHAVRGDTARALAVMDTVRALARVVGLGEP